jgi:hypothetical protein
METLLMNFEDYRKISKRKTSSQCRLEKQASASKFKLESIDFQLKKMKIGKINKGSFLSGRKLKEAPRQFKRFIKNKFSAKTKDRIRTFEKFSFTSLEKMNNGLKD